ncbi:MAG: VWA domain-containing protein [Myxococcales bacterium]|nr:VWA domain-containing protein [Myxococcales bacterium]
MTLDRPRLAAALFALVACGDDSSGRESASASATAGITGLTGITSASASASTGSASDGSTGGSASSSTGGASASAGSASAGDDCVSNDDCPPGQHCTSFTGVCVDEGGCVLGEDCEGGFVCERGECSIGGDCGAMSFEITKLPPNLLVMLDRSGSMGGEIDGKTRWDIAREAVGGLVNDYNAEIRFGLDTYSACLPGGCSAGTIVVPIADNNAGAVTGFLSDKLGEGSDDGQGQGNGGINYLCDSGDPETSTGKSLQAMVGEPSLQDNERGNAVLLITDGGESGECKQGTDGPSAAGELLAQAIPVKTYVVGFSGDVNETELTAVAQAGGTDMYYQANDLDQLGMAFQEIAKSVATCDYKLDEVPPDIKKIFVFFNDDPMGIPNDPNDGWVYDPVSNTIKFVGGACTMIKDGTVYDVDIVYGCNAPIPG